MRDCKARFSVLIDGNDNRHYELRKGRIIVVRLVKGGILEENLLEINSKQ
jgi:hypothetical protein